MRSCRTPQVRYDNCKPAAQNKSLMLVWEKLEGGELSSIEEPPLLPPASTSADSTWGVPNTHSWIERNKQPVPKKAKRNTVKGDKYSSLSKKMHENFYSCCTHCQQENLMQGACLVNKGGKIRKTRNKQTNIWARARKKKLHSSQRKRNKSCLCFDTLLIQSFNIKFKVRSL